MNNTTLNKYIESYCFYLSSNPPPPNNPLSRSLETISLAINIPGYLLSSSIGVAVGLVESLPVEAVLFSFKSIGISVPYSINKVIYTGINTAVGFLIPRAAAFLVSDNILLANTIGVYGAGAAFLGSLNAQQGINDEDNELFAKSVVMNSISYINSLVVATCPIILSAKAVDALVEKMEAAKIVDYSSSRTPFTFIPEALYSAGGIEQSGYDRYPLHNAAALNQMYRAKALLASLDELRIKRILTESDTQDSGTYTAFNLAAFHGQKNMVEFFVNKYADLGISINTPDEDGKTALMVAAAKGHWEAFNFLADKYLELGFHMDERDSSGNTAIHYISAALLFSEPSAEQFDLYSKIIQVLTKNGVDINALNHLGKSASYIAENNDVSSVKAQEIAENIEQAHLISKLLNENPDISTLISRMMKGMLNIKNEKSDGKIITELLLQSNVKQSGLNGEEVTSAKDYSYTSYSTLEEYYWEIGTMGNSSESEL